MPTGSEKAPMQLLSVAPAAEHSILHRAKAFPFVGEGSVYAFGLREYLVEPTILAGESAVAALCATDTGLAYGLTCGNRAHLFYFHPGFGVCDVGVISDKPVGGGAVLHLAGGNARVPSGRAKHRTHDGDATVWVRLGQLQPNAAKLLIEQTLQPVSLVARHEGGVFVEP
ncbi:MAG: hypothetical protein WCP21_06750 [Armatimonadota bacterium]